MVPVETALRSSEFEVWEPVVRPRLVLAFSVVSSLPVADVEEIVDDAISHAEEWWPEVAATGRPHAWVYATARKLARERFPGSVGGGPSAV